MWRDRAIRQHANITFSIKTERAGSEPRLKPESRQGTQLSGATFFHFGSPRNRIQNSTFTQVLRFRYVVTIYSNYTVS